MFGAGPKKSEIESTDNPHENMRCGVYKVKIRILSGNLGLRPLAALPQTSGSISDAVITTWDRGWGNDQYAKLLLILSANGRPTRYRRWY